MSKMLSRRSVRKYTDEPVSEETIAALLRAAMSAPSAGNQQPWHFIVIRSQAVRDLIPTVHPHAAMVPRAPVAIAVCGDVSGLKYEGYWVQDCSAATENLLLAAHEMDLGAVWLGVYPTEDRVEGVSRVLGLPEHIVPFALIPIGHPAESIPAVDRFDPGRVHQDRWPDN